MNIEDILQHPKTFGDRSLEFTGLEDALVERRLVLDHVIDPNEATPRDRFEAFSTALRDLFAKRWIETTRSHDTANPKQVYYLSMEFLIGRSLANN
jgi:starch phosphorylase